MLRYAVTRVIHLVPILLGISIIAFALMYLSPSDPAMMMLNAQGTAPSQELLAETRHEMGLDQPAPVQYVNWLIGVFQGNFGFSYVYNAPVMQVIASRLPVTFALSFAALALTILISVPLGIVAALHENRAIDWLVQTFEFSSLSMPTFWLGLLLIYVFALSLGWLPAISNSTKAVGYILPTIALSFSYIGRLIGQVRIDVIEEMQRPYVMGLRSRGISERRIIWRHVMRNALSPSITVIGLAFGAMLSGSITTEMVFSMQGLGFMSIQAIDGRDYALVQAYVLVTATFFVIVNLIVDLAYHATNPQLRMGVEGASHE